MKNIIEPHFQVRLFIMFIGNGSFHSNNIDSEVPFARGARPFKCHSLDKNDPIACDDAWECMQKGIIKLDRTNMSCSS